MKYREPRPLRGGRRHTAHGRDGLRHLGGAPLREDPEKSSARLPLLSSDSKGCGGGAKPVATKVSSKTEKVPSKEDMGGSEAGG